MKKLIILFCIFSATLNAQDLKLSLGYKSAEIGLSKTLQNELIFGGSLCLTDSEQIAKRANQFNQEHKIYNKVIPSAFILMGAEFDRLNLMGKVGACYIQKQDVKETNGNVSTTTPYNNIMFLAVGFNIMYMVSDKVGFSVSFDNVNAGMLGINYKL